MEQKDWGTLNFKGQSLILDLNASGVNYIVICREKDEKENKIVDEIKDRLELPRGFMLDGFWSSEGSGLRRQFEKEIGLWPKD